jgi:hypothetical protein
VSYTRSYMNDERNHKGERWSIGTVRCRDDTKRARWFIATPNDRDYETAYALIRCIGGEYFDGTQWRAMGYAIECPLHSVTKTGVI